MVMSLKCHSDAIEKQDAILTKQVHRITVRFLSCVPVLPGSVVAMLPSSALSLGWATQALS